MNFRFFFQAVGTIAVMCSWQVLVHLALDPGSLCDGIGMGGSLAIFCASYFGERRP